MNQTLWVIVLTLFLLSCFVTVHLHVASYSSTKQQQQQSAGLVAPVSSAIDTKVTTSTTTTTTTMAGSSAIFVKPSQDEPFHLLNRSSLETTTKHQVSYFDIVNQFLPVDITTWASALYDLLQVHPSDPIEDTSTSEKFLSLVGTKLGRQCSVDDPCTLCVATAIYMEEPYLEEWIYYHLLMGVDHFYLVHMVSLTLASRKSQNATLALLQKFIDRGVVTISTFMGIYDSPQLLEQIHSMSISISRYAKYSKWFINLDPDEFYFSWRYPYLKYLLQPSLKWRKITEDSNGDHVFPENHNFTIVSAADVSCVGLPWLMFGSSGHLKRPPGTTIESYIRRSIHLLHEPYNSTRFYGRLHGKFLFRTECFHSLPNPHHLLIRQICQQCTLQVPLTNDSNRYIPSGLEESKRGFISVAEKMKVPFHLKHYQTKSYQDWMWKRFASGFTGVRTMEIRDDGLKPGYWNSVRRNWRQEWENTDRLFNDTVDRDMSVYWDLMRRIMFNATAYSRWCFTMPGKVNWAPLSCF